MKYVKTQHVSLAVVAAVILMLGASTINADTIGYWRFEGDATGFVTDSSGNGFTLTKGDGITPAKYPTQVDLPGTGDGAKFDNPIPWNGLTNAKVASLDGGDYFKRADDTKFAVTDFTIEAYIVRTGDDTAGGKAVASQWGATISNGSWVFDVVNKDDASYARQLRFYFGEGSNFYAVTSGSAMTIAMNTDYFVAGTFKHATLGDNGEVKFYIKNLETDTWQTSSTINHSITSLNDSTADFNISCYNNASEKFPGLMDEVRWTDTVLTQGDLLAVPEPSTIVLLVSGLLGLLLLRRRWRK